MRRLFITMNEINKIHLACIEMAIEASQRGGFEKLEWNAEKELFVRDVKEIIQHCRGRITEKEMSFILDDMRYIVDFQIKQFLQNNYE